MSTRHLIELSVLSLATAGLVSGVSLLFLQRRGYFEEPKQYEERVRRQRNANHDKKEAPVRPGYIRLNDDLGIFDIRRSQNGQTGFFPKPASDNPTKVKFQAN